jgi:uncharacterized membrane protein YdfJ with MMPL/SSD domain
MPDAAARIAPGTTALVSGDAAGSADFSNRLRTATPVVIAFVLGLTLVLLFAAFRSLWLAAAVVALNLVSVGATYGILAAVFQRHWAEGLLSFTSTGTVSDWVPLFAFVILDMKQLGFCLAAAVLLDATIVRGVALPAAVALLGDRRWRVAPRPGAARRWDDERTGGPVAAGTAAPARGHAN